MHCSLVDRPFHLLYFSLFIVMYQKTLPFVFIFFGRQGGVSILQGGISLGLCMVFVVVYLLLLFIQRFLPGFNLS